METHDSCFIANEKQFSVNFKPLLAPGEFRKLVFDTKTSKGVDAELGSIMIP